jgi:hypothetical protein
MEPQMNTDTPDHVAARTALHRVEQTHPDHPFVVAARELIDNPSQKAQSDLGALVWDYAGHHPEEPTARRLLAACRLVYYASVLHNGSKAKRHHRGAYNNALRDMLKP